MNPNSVASPAFPTTPSAAEKFFFDTQGYIVLENFFKAEHVARLQTALTKAIARRRSVLPSGWKAVWPPRGVNDLTQVNGARSTRILNILEDDPLFLELLSWPDLLAYVHAFLNPQPHYCASDAIVEDPADFQNRRNGWHIDGSDNGYRNLGPSTPILQLKLGIYLTDMTKPWQGNLTVVPGSHLTRSEPSLSDRECRDFFPGALQVCAAPGSAILFHNAIWHTAAPYNAGAPGRMMLYYAYEHPWMMASTAHWNYGRAFYNGLGPTERSFFHGFVFDPPEVR